MILRLGMNAAGHAAAGAAIGFLGVLAACTVAQVAAQGMRDARGMGLAPRAPGSRQGPGIDEPPAGAP